jgi:hypothetical protein
MDHRERSETGRSTIISRGTSNSNGISDAVHSHMQCKCHFSITQASELVLVHWNSAVVTIESLESASQLIVPYNFQNESSSTTLTEPEVHSQETIRVEHRLRSGTGRGYGTPKPGRAGIISRERTNCNGSSDGLASESSRVQEGSLQFSSIKKLNLF